MNVDNASKCFAELGNPHRLEAFRLLVRAGPDGLTVGEIQQHLGIPKSTLSHHCLHLISVGLVEQRREGRTIRCFANCGLTQELAEFLIEQCCMGVELVETGKTETG
ncbi:MAG: helix-turn-helix transcriptional regulator [Alphaproteobacteria bacterium]|jgi:ArsR family transcriptional regulator|nr:helix-turn-helix transcriptional regulator [Alphaproteobacteria bacterium]